MMVKRAEEIIRETVIDKTIGKTDRQKWKKSKIIIDRKNSNMNLKMGQKITWERNRD